MSKVTDIGLFILGAIALTMVNVMALVYDAEWINVAIALDSSFVGALIAKFLTRST